jgi:hypothetical protein
MRAVRSLLLTAVPLVAAACIGGDDPTTGVYQAQVTTVPAGTSCAQLGLGAQEFRIDDPVDGTYLIDAVNSLLFRYYDDTNTIFFYTQSTIRMNGVLVQSGDTTAVWELPGANGWPSLHGPIDPSTGEPSTPDSVSFCYDYELFLNPNAYAHYGRKHTWDVAKTGFAGSLLLAEGQTYLAQYTVTVTPTGSTDSGLFIEGPVFVNNPTPYTPRLDGLTVLVGDIPAEVTCPVAFPYILPAFSTLTCTFYADVPDTSDRLVYVDVATDGSILVDRSLETASFSDHTTTTGDIDECVKVLDDRAPYAGGFLGTACITEGTKTFTYLGEIGPFDACGPFEVVNTATIEGLDTGTTDTATWTVGGQVPCSNGCTLTPGYWKTHSQRGPAPYDDTWALLPQAENTPFLSSGKTYYYALWTPPKSSAYWILAHAYIAAELNGLNEASTSAVDASLLEARALLTTYTPASTLSASVRARFLALATALDQYNNGRTGPGHCSE